MLSNDKKPSTWQFISPSNQTSSLFPLMTIRTGLSEHPLPLTNKSSCENQTRKVKNVCCHANLSTKNIVHEEEQGLPTTAFVISL